jgi:hypothetical protein
MAKIESDTQFWEAIDKTNKALEPSGLYVSHLFTDRQVALTAGWLDKIVEIPSGEFKYLKLFRPSSLDLILTKMMRNDREDLGDIKFILEHEIIEPKSIDAAFKTMRALESPELQEIVLKMQPVVRNMAIAIDAARPSKGMPPKANYSSDPDWWSKLTRDNAPQKSSENDRDLSL